MLVELEGGSVSIRSHLFPGHYFNEKERLGVSSYTSLESSLCVH